MSRNTESQTQTEQTGTYEFTSAEIATLLASLRLFQQEFDSAESAKEAFEDHFAEHQPLNYDEIDELCDRINSGCDQ